MQATCIENIDIGGPAMIRASAKNNAAVPRSYLAQTVKGQIFFVSLRTCELLRRSESKDENYSDHSGRQA